MKLSLSSSVTDSIKQSAQLAEELGLGIEISRFPNFRNIDSNLDEIIMSLQKSLLGFTNNITLHGMFFDQSIASNDPAIKEVSQRRHRQSFKTAKAIGANILVFHSGHKGMKHKVSFEKFRDNSIIFWKEFIKEFEDSGITAVIENVLERHPQLLLDIINEVNSPFLKFSLDTGHANLFSEIPVSDWIKLYGKKLHHMHIHNNYGDDDSHNSLTDGTVDFIEIFTTLKELSIKPTIIFEMFKKDNLYTSLEYFNKNYGEKLCLEK